MAVVSTSKDQVVKEPLTCETKVLVCQEQRVPATWGLDAKRRKLRDKRDITTVFSLKAGESATVACACDVPQFILETQEYFSVILMWESASRDEESEDGKQIHTTCLGRLSLSLQELLVLQLERDLDPASGLQFSSGVRSGISIGL